MRLSRCCNPVPGDEILGFVTRGRGVSVHRADCPNAQDLKQTPERIIEVAWENDLPKNTSFKVEVFLDALDRMNLLRDVAIYRDMWHIDDPDQPIGQRPPGRSGRQEQHWCNLDARITGQGSGVVNPGKNPEGQP